MSRKDREIEALRAVNARWQRLNESLLAALGRSNEALKTAGERLLALTKQYVALRAEQDQVSAALAELERREE